MYSQFAWPETIAAADSTVAVTFGASATSSSFSGDMLAAGTYYNDRSELSDDILDALVDGLNAADTGVWYLYDVDTNTGRVELYREGDTDDALYLTSVVFDTALRDALGLTKQSYTPADDELVILNDDDFVVRGKYQRNNVWLPREVLVQSEPDVTEDVDVAAGEADASFFLQSYGEYNRYEIIFERVPACLIAQQYADSAFFIAEGTARWGLVVEDPNIALQNFWSALKSLAGAVRYSMDVSDTTNYLEIAVRDEQWLGRLMHGATREGRSRLRYTVTIPAVEWS